jgi:hypothetical protein
MTWGVIETMAKRESWPIANAEEVGGISRRRDMT